ncbi:MAG TPA: biotin-dependent carboxyltransferase family protein [Candidatus Nitrosotalea sp.]|nr:biotin-dependent carboxyltransferase family protein [Candidatus Nitrosotalea sp.]
MPEGFKVLGSGPLATLQDLGRPGHRSAGIPPGGAMDRFALIAANRLVGNPDGLAALEITRGGLILKALGPALLAVAGGEPSLRLNGSVAPAWTSFLVSAGDRISLEGMDLGERAYVAVRGGFLGQLWLGSRSTYALAGLGGLGRRLGAGDRIDRGEIAGAGVAGRRLEWGLRPQYSGHARLRVLAGPHLELLLPPARDQLLQSEWSLTEECDRMGYRLRGPAMAPLATDLASFPVTTGCVQLPPGGQPILLMSDHPASGGYPVPVTVISADLPLAAQLRPHDRLRLELVDLDQAAKARAEQRAALDSIRS